MPFAFPPFDHLPLKRPPLAEVVCQIRFPPVLDISHTEPAAFQEMVRNRFPKFATERGVQIRFPAISNQIPTTENTPPVYRFKNRTEASRISLAQDWYAVDTTDYNSWETFADDLRLATEATINIYKVPYVTRIGLRYINKLYPDNTNQQDIMGVIGLLRSELTQLMTLTEILDASIQTHIRADQDDCTFSFRSGIIKDEQQMSVFLLDFDVYSENELELSIDGLLEQCEQYHKVIYNAFRWSFAETTDIDSLFN